MAKCKGHINLWNRLTKTFKWPVITAVHFQYLRSELSVKKETEVMENYSSPAVTLQQQYSENWHQNLREF